MDASNFSIQLDLAGSGLIQAIEDQLLQGDKDNMRIRPELYKLNVYGKNFLSHSPASSFSNTFACTQKRIRSSRRTRTPLGERTCLGRS
jgi:hypothetical protein